MLPHVVFAFLVGIAATAADSRAQGAARSDCNGHCGVIEAIVPVQERQVWTPLGTVASGSVSNNSLGSTPTATTQMQFGPGFSRQGIVVIGAAGGAVYAQKPTDYRRLRWDVTLKMDDGATRVVSTSYEPLFVQEGDHVRVSGNRFELVDR